MPTLNWIGKEKVINHHRDVPFRILEHKYCYPTVETGLRPVSTTIRDTQTNDVSGNKIIHGDNLEALKALLPEYEGLIKCICIDPPYNTGNENWIYNDNVNDPKIKKWLAQVVGKEGEDLSRHDKWLCMMYPRLQLLHKLLADDGVIFVSLDENEATHLKLLMNEIFGEDNFVAQLTLLCNPKGRSQDKYFSTSHEYITVYSKTKKPKDSFSVTKDDELILKEYKLEDSDGRYRLMELRNTHREFSKQNRPNLFYPFFVSPNTGKVSLKKNKEFTEEVTPLWPDSFEGCWTWGQELAEKDNHLLIAQNVKGTWKIYRKSYAISDEGDSVKKKLFTIWQNSKFYTEKGQSAFGDIFPGLNKNDFPQPKSVDLIIEMLRTSTSNADIILDSFAGSGTTAHAVLNLNKEDGGNRKFILIEMEDYAETITAERVKRVIQGYGEGNSKTEGTGGEFSFYTLGEPLFVENNLNPKLPVEKIREYIYFMETKLRLPVSDKKDNKYLLGVNSAVAYYFLYNPKEDTELDYAFLKTIKTKADEYIIYADNCLLTTDFLQSKRITFKKIPREIPRI